MVGSDEQIMSDLVWAGALFTSAGPFVFTDVLDVKHLRSIVVNHNIDWLVHFSALLSAVGENNVPLALQVEFE